MPEKARDMGIHGTEPRQGRDRETAPDAGDTDGRGESSLREGRPAGREREND